MKINTPYRDAATNRNGRLRFIRNGIATLRTANGGYVRVPVDRLRRVVSKASLENLAAGRAKPRRSKYSAEVVESAAKFGLSPNQYLDALQCK